jgi:limonene 1,2-monooxygenase
MEFGIFSNGFRPHTSASQTYEEDLNEIVLADRLGFRDAYISEHHGEPVYINKVDTLPIPELLMCKVAGLTKQIRMGAAVKLIHLAHPVDTAIQAAVTDHVVGGGRFIFGFGSGFPNPLFANERGLSHEDRHPRLRESLDLILKCWAAEEPFDWNGKYWQGKNIVATPRPLHAPHMPMATATDTEAMVELAGSRGYTLLAAQLEPASFIRRKADRYARAAKAAGRSSPLKNIAVARYVYLADSPREAMEDLRSAITYELGFQIKRGLIRMLKSNYNWQFTGDDVSFDQLAEVGWVRHAADSDGQGLGNPREARTIHEAFHGTRGAAAPRPGAGPRARRSCGLTTAFRVAQGDACGFGLTSGLRRLLSAARAIRLYTP